jgi:hypothetical protein
MSNELERDRAMVMNLESFGVRVDGVGYDETSGDRAAKFDKPAVKIMFQGLRSDCTFPA